MVLEGWCFDINVAGSTKDLQILEKKTLPVLKLSLIQLNCIYQASFHGLWAICNGVRLRQEEQPSNEDKKILDIAVLIFLNYVA